MFLTMWSRLLTKDSNVSDDVVDIIPFDNIYVRCNFARSMLFTGGSIYIIHKSTMNVNLGYNYVKQFNGGVKWNILEHTDDVFSLGFNLLSENGNLLSINGQDVSLFFVEAQEFLHIYAFRK